MTKTLLRYDSAGQSLTPHFFPPCTTTIISYETANGDPASFCWRRLPPAQVGFESITRLLAGLILHLAETKNFRRRELRERTTSVYLLSTCLFASLRVLLFSSRSRSSSSLVGIEAATAGFAEVRLKRKGASTAELPQ